MQPEFEAALPPQIPVQRFIRTLITTVQMQPDLLQADRRTLFAACMKAAQDGLLLDGREAAPVIFRKKDRDGGWTSVVQYMPMIGGILKKMRNSGELASINAHVVYDADLFEYELGDNEEIKHKPHLGPNRGKPIAAYAIARTKDGSVWREVMGVEEIEKVRAVSRAKESGPWVSFWDEMARKTVIRRLAKRLPSSADIDQVFDSDNEASGFVQRESVKANVTTPGPLSRLKAQMVEVDQHVAEAEPVAAEAPAENTDAGT
jgi:recombination protein RecT